MLLAYTLTLWLAPLLLHFHLSSVSCVSVSVSVFDVPDQLLGCQQVQVLGLLSPVRAMAHALWPVRTPEIAGGRGRRGGGGGRVAGAVFFVEGVTALASRGHNIKTWWNFTKIKVLTPSTLPQSHPMPGQARPCHPHPVASDNDNSYDDEDDDGRHLVSMSGSMSMWMSNCGRGGVGEGVRFYDHGPGRLLDMAKCALAA